MGSLGMEVVDGGRSKGPVWVAVGKAGPSGSLEVGCCGTQLDMVNCTKSMGNMPG